MRVFRVKWDKQLRNNSVLSPHDTAVRQQDAWGGRTDQNDLGCVVGELGKGFEAQSLTFWGVEEIKKQAECKMEESSRRIWMEGRKRIQRQAGYPDGPVPRVEHCVLVTQNRMLLANLMNK